MPTDTSANFPKALKYYMSANGKKQQDLIAELKLSSATVSQWVNGKAFPRMDRVEMLANYFGISTAELFIDPYAKPKPLANPVMMAKLLESSQPLYELFTVTINLQEKDLHILKTVAERLIELETQLNPPEEL
jgi:transcriptional regulator with XRE-family HTH domain